MVLGQMDEGMIEIRNLEKRYLSPDGGSVLALEVGCLVISPAQQVAVVGPSGSGKSTLLSIIGGVVDSSSGTMLWNGEPWTGKSAMLSARSRARRVGFVFQDLNLLPGMSISDNLETAAWFLGVSRSKTVVRRALDRVGLSGRHGHKVEQLSRGERQRAAIARAMLYPHDLILADEPTASLDSENSELIMNILITMAADNGSALLVATHDARVMKMLPYKFELTGGGSVSTSNCTSTQSKDASCPVTCG